jgi:Uma2 family endonuclease
MIELGVLTEGDGVELIDGQILHKGGWRDGGPVVYRFTPEQCLRMSAAGIVSEDEAFTLAEEGAIPEMPRSPAHDSAIDRLDDALRALLPLGWRLRIQSAIWLPGGEPEPDLAVVLGPVGRYDAHHPRPNEVAVVVEVADTTLQYDRTLKLRGYAQAQIPVYWIVNLEDRQVEVYSNPITAGTPGYATTAVYRVGDLITFTVAGAQAGTVAVVDLLP